MLFDTIQVISCPRYSEVPQWLLTGRFDAEPQSGRVSARFD
jgi:hypothetical protein